MKIGSKIGEHEIKIGDLFDFDFEKLEGTPFINSNLYQEIKKHEADELNIYFGLNPFYNIVEYDLQFIKENRLVYSEKSNNSMFLSYLKSKSESIQFLTNNTPSINKNIENVSDLSISKENNRINEGDLFLVSAEDVKKTGYIKPEFMDKFEKEGLKHFLFHFYNVKYEIKHSHTNIGMCCYAISDSGFITTLSEEKKKFYQERYDKSKSEFDKVPTFIIQYGDDLNLDLLKKMDCEYHFFDKKIGNIRNTYKIDYDQIKSLRIGEVSQSKKRKI